MSNEHTPVLYREVLDFVQPHAGGAYIDGTLGAGGHALGILRHSEPDGRLLAFDRDPEALAFAKQRIAQQNKDWLERVQFAGASFAQMAEIAPQLGFAQVDGILLDLGLSSRQLDDPHRGFSFRKEGPLDMRFDPGQAETAGDLVNTLTATELADLFWRYGDERRSRRYAQAIMAARPLATTSELASVVAAATRGPRGRIHPATRVFQALRIAVNDELGALEEGLVAAVSLLKQGGRLVIISFHSLEDRIVKHGFRQLSRDCVCPPEQPQCICDTNPQLRLVTRKVVRPSEDEVKQNPRSRSAKLRVAEKLTGSLPANLGV